MLSYEEREKLGLMETLPQSLEESLEAFQRSKGWMETTLGKKYTEYFVLLKREEIEMWNKMEVDARRLMMTTFY